MANEVNITMTAKDLASGKIKGVGDQAKTSMDKLRGMRGQFLAVGAAGAAVVGMLAMFTKSALDQQVGVNLLDNALKNVGKSYGAEKDAIEAVIGAIQDKTNFGDEEQRTALTQLIALTGDYETSLDALGVATDLAAGLGMDFNSASQLLAKVLAGNTSMLSRYGVTIDSSASKTEILQTLTDKFGGSAEAAKDPITQLNNRLGDLAQVMGDVLLPIIDAVLPAIEKVTKAIVSFAEENPALTTTLVILTATVGLLAIGIAAMGLVIPLAATAFGALGIGVTGAALAFVGFNLATGGILLAIGLVVAGIVALIMNWDEVVRAVKVGINFMSGAIEVWANFYIKAINKIIDGVNVLAGVFGQEIGQIADLEIPRFNTAMEEMAEVSDEVKTEIIEDQEEVTDAMQVELDKQARQLNEATQRIKDAGEEQRRIWKNTFEYEQEIKERARDKQKQIDEEVAAQEQAVYDATLQRLADAGEEQRRIRQATHDFRMELGEAEVEEQERLLKIEEAASAEIIRIEEEEAAQLVAAEEEKQADLKKLREEALADEIEAAELRKANREQALAETLKDAELRMDAVKALREENREAFARIKAEVDLLPANIQTQTSVGMSREALDNRAGVMQSFKDSQNRMTDALEAAQALLASGEFGGGTTKAMAQAEVDRLMGITGSAGFKGTALGALLAPKGGYGSSAPPMLPGMEFGAAAATQGHTTINFYGDTFGLDNFTDKVNEGITAAQQRGATMWIDRGEDR